MNQERYRIEQNFTDGWGVVDERMDVTLTKEQCRIRYEQYLTDGVSPQYLRIIRES